MDDKQFIRIAKALADPRRFEIFEVIAGTEEMSCGAVAERFPIGQSTVSHHLKILTDAGLLDVRREGQHGFFKAKPEVLWAYIEELKERLRLSPERMVSGSGGRG
ncbi:MAG: ArsR family transcriptional regulator [Deltaproteobacteria bacterium]|nr:MAG: ArsR family transcriptional regulator [Deltaproteobacteria bacterium]